MNWMESRVIRLGIGFASVGIVMALAWAAVCLGHSSDNSFTAHCVMTGLTAVVVIGIAAASLRSIKTRRSR